MEVRRIAKVSGAKGAAGAFDGQGLSTAPTGSFNPRAGAAPVEPTAAGPDALATSVNSAGRATAGILIKEEPDGEAGEGTFEMACAFESGTEWAAASGAGIAPGIGLSAGAHVREGSRVSKVAPVSTTGTAAIGDAPRFSG
jgi:hypothetical protein